MKVKILTLGCPKNEFDSSVLEKLFLKKQFTLVDDIDNADVVILNTCSFVKDAVEESKETAEEIKKHLKKNSLFVVTGCAVNYFKDEIKDVINGAHMYVDIENEEKLPELLRKEKSGLVIGKQKPGGGHPSGRVVESSQENRSFAYLKVAEGCSNFCSYCAIPLIRGTVKSVPQNLVLKEARRLLKSGVKELILIAQDVSSYGKDLADGKDLPGLVREISKLNKEKDFWIRLLYMNPDNIDSNLLNKLLSVDKVIPYLDIPIQTGSDRIRKKMGRKKEINKILEMIKETAKRYPGKVLRTSFLVGFPGETEEDILDTIDFMKELDPDYIAVFPYSKMKGTRAFSMRDSVSEREILERVNELTEVADGLMHMKALQKEGEVEEILIDRVDKKQSIGRYFGQSPQIDGEVYIFEKLTPGNFIKAKLVKSQGMDYKAKVINI